jgi:hypothetical protein
MARQHRVEYPGAVYHHGNGERDCEAAGDGNGGLREQPAISVAEGDAEEVSRVANTKN